MFRLCLASGLLAAMTAAAGAAAQASVHASRPAVACPRLEAVVQVELGVWDAERDLFALVGSDGADRPGGYVIYGAATAAKATTDRACRRTSLRTAPSRARLSKPIFYRRAGDNVFFQPATGDRMLPEQLHRRSVDAVASRSAYGIAFRCPAANAITVVISNSRDPSGRVVGSRLSVRHDEEVLATATVRTRGESFFRVSDRCRRA